LYFVTLGGCNGLPVLQYDYFFSVHHDLKSMKS
jgi:hypothetical protein